LIYPSLLALACKSAFSKEEPLTVGYYNTFVVRIWCDDEGELTRGYIQHVSTDEHTYFLDIQDVNAFILDHLGPPSNSITEEERRGGLPLLAEGIGDIGQDG
jgi:hypothetical protein